MTCKNRGRGRFSRRAKIIFLRVIGIIGLVLLAGYPAAEVRADTNPIDLVLGGAGATGASRQ